MTQYSAWRADPPTDPPTDPEGFEPPAPRRLPPVFPTMPDTSPARPDAAAATSGPRIVLVALVSALIGGLLAGGTVVLALDRRAVELEAGDADQAVQTATVETSGEPTQVEAVALAVLPSVVQININGRGGEVGMGGGNGSGVIYRSDGHILTNNHVVESARSLEVAFSDGERVDAKVVGRDPLSDLAVIKVDRSGLPAVQIGDTESLRVGQLAVAIGSPFGLEGSVTAGVVSALNRPISITNRLRLPNVIQTDAPINPGNSGGALVGADGRLIGINSAILTAGSPANAGVGFAIPVDLAVDIADQLIEAGAISYPFLGVEGSDVTEEVAERFGVDSGALIDRVEEGTPADEVGLRAGDVITRVGEVDIESMDDLILAIRRADIGDDVEITYRRADEERTVSVTLSERPDDL